MVQCLAYLGLAAEKADSTPALVCHPFSVATLVGGFMKTCSKCGIEKPLEEFFKNKRDGHLSACKVCHLETQRKYRERLRVEGIKRNPLSVEAINNKREYKRKWQAKNKKKVNAHNRIAKALKAGKINRGACEVCGSDQVDGHHCDYDKPMEVMWLCKLHHKQWHVKHGSGLNQT